MNTDRQYDGEHAHIMLANDDERRLYCTFEQLFQNQPLGAQIDEIKFLLVLLHNEQSKYIDAVNIATLNDAKVKL